MPTKKLHLARGLVAAGATAAMIFSLAACSSGSDSGDSSSSGEPSGSLQILVSSASGSDAAFKAMDAAFEAKYPDVKVTLTSVSNDNYPATKSARLTAGNVDIFVVKSFTEAPDYAKDSTSDDVLLAQSGGLVDLTNESFMSQYTPTVLEAQAIGGKQYAVPTGVSYSTGIYYNKAIFAKYDLSVPTTWSEMLNVISVLSKHGITPFGIGGKDSWPAGLPMLGSVASLYPTLDAKQKLAESLWKNTAKLTDAEPESILEKTETILENAQTNFAGAGYDEIPAAFAAKKFAMTPDGTWDDPTIESAVDGAFDVGYFPLPASENAADNALLNGKIELQLGVASATKNKTAALAWLSFFSDPANYKTFVAKSGFSASQPNIPTTDFLESIADYTKTYQPAWDQVWIANNKAGQDAVFPFNYPALKPLGSSTAAEAAAAAQTAWSAAF